MIGNNRKCICFSYDLIGNGHFRKLRSVAIIYLSCSLIYQVGGSIHEYHNQSFNRRSNSFFFHSGSEGLYASKLHIDPDKKDSSSSPEDNHVNDALGLVENLENIDDLTGKARLFLVLPLSLLDACFIVWIFSALSQTLEKLQIQSMAKFALYQKFINSLAISVLLSIAWVGYELYFNAADPLSELWQRAWIIPALWNLLGFALLTVICTLWAPSNNPTRFAFSEETGDDFEEEGISLTSSTVILAGESVTMLERKVSNADLFGFVEEVE